MPNSIESVLYGPSINFRSDEWVKCSLLLWDSIYRIVPTTVRPDDSPTVKLAQDAGLIRQITLEPEDLKITCSEFLRFIKELPGTPAGLESEGMDRIHEEKVDGRLYPLLETLAIDVDSEGWLCLPSRLARGYMLYLAKSVSGRRNLATATDDADAWAIMPYFKERANFDERVYNPEAQAFYSFMIFRDILPSQIVSVSIDKIIEFATKRKDEKGRLRSVLHRFSESVRNCASPSHAAELVTDYKRQIEQAKDEFKRSMGFYNEDQGNSLLTIGLPLALTVFSSFGGSDPYSLLNVSKSICIGAIAAFSDYKKIKKTERKESYASYLVEIDRELKGHSRAQAANRVFEEFMND
jgi:hypothetical protein